MRISDWSSDVCSSDLTQHEAGTCRPRAFAPLAWLSETVTNIALRRLCHRRSVFSVSNSCPSRRENVHLRSGGRTTGILGAAPVSNLHRHQTFITSITCLFAAPILLLAPRSPPERKGVG